MSSYPHLHEAKCVFVRVCVCNDRQYNLTVVKVMNEKQMRMTLLQSSCNVCFNSAWTMPSFSAIKAAKTADLDF